VYVRKTVVNSGLMSAFAIDVVQELPVCKMCTVHYTSNIQFDRHTKTLCVISRLEEPLGKNILR
jgi:hypothetical protein